MDFQRITVIDDSPEILDVLGDALRRHDVEVTLLGARTTIDQIAASQPDVLMVDLRLGTDHLPGWEIIRNVHAHPSLRDVPIVVCSGALDQMRGYGGATAGPRTHLLPKPFSLDDLDAVLAEAVASRVGSTETVAMPVGSMPGFAEDPYAWFGRIADEMRGESWPTSVSRMQPAISISPLGHPWRLIRTPRGIEVRPDLVSPFLRYGNQPMVSALGLTEEALVEVELTTSRERWVDRFPKGTFDVAALGHAMLDERKLPHDNLPQLFPPLGGAPPIRPGASSSAFSVRGRDEVLHR